LYFIVLRLDDIPLEKGDGLGIIPLEILGKGTKAITKFILDLYKAPEGEALYRSKIMTVGFESVGKTTIIDILFPLKGYLTTKELTFLKEKKEKKTFYFVLQGNYLRRYLDQDAFQNHPQEPLETLHIAHKEWAVEEYSKEEKGQHGLILLPTGKKKSAKPLDMRTDDLRTRDAWLVRLRRVCLNYATHGIEIHNFKVDHPSVKVPLELSVWDFAGQVEYYQNHHYFISNRTVFLVLWKMKQGDKGMKGLKFWLHSLASHLSSAESGASGVFYSIFVVGTFLDAVGGEAREAREAKMRKLARQCGLNEDIIQYQEVSCSTLENISDLQTCIFQSALSHSYMGEVVPKSYLSVLQLLQHEKAKLAKKDVPILTLEGIAKEVTGGDLELAKRALKLLNLWGECVYFERPEELANTVVLDPGFLTKEVLGQFFSPQYVVLYRDGIVNYADLGEVWSGLSVDRDFEEVSLQLVNLMKKFEVCFTIEEDLNKPFREQRLLVPGLLPEKKESSQDPGEVEKRDRLWRVWPRDCPFDRPLQLERILKFNVLPGELVSRIIVRLHSLIQEGLVWRNDLILFDEKSNTQAMIQVDPSLSRFVIFLRSSERLSCGKMMKNILDEVTVSLAQHPSVSVCEEVRSPHDQSVSIVLDEVWEDSKRKEEKRKLICPATLLPIRAEKLLLTAGLIDEDPPTSLLIPSLCPFSCFLISFPLSSLSLPSPPYRCHTSLAKRV